MTTLKDVAKLAEVDIGSVSRTLSNHPRAKSLRPETRQRIFDAAKKLGYRRNVFAAAMRSGKNRTVAVINTDSLEIRQTPSSLRVMLGITGAASEANYALKVYTDSDLPKVIDDILSNRITKVVCMTPQFGKREETAMLCRANHLSLVYVYETGHGEYPSVAADNFGISRDVVKYLAEHGHRRIALVCGEYQKWHYMMEKYNGYLAGLRESGIEPSFQRMILRNEPDAEILKMLKLPAETRPTAFFCIGDGFAMKVQRYAVKLGLRLPEDVSVTGFGETNSGMDAVAPLSSVNEEQEKLGAEAFRLVIGGSSEFPPDEENVYRIRSEFVERESVFDLRKK